MFGLIRWFLELCCTGCVVLACWAWLDRPLALWVHAHRLGGLTRAGFQPLNHIPDPLIPLGAVSFIVLGLWALAGGRLSRLLSVVLACWFAVVTTETIKNGLKWIFGRPWPDSWRGEGPSLVRTGDYSFHWLAGGDAYSSFPSGHMAAAAAVLGVVSIYFPRARAFCIGFGVLVGGALVSLNYHFVGDVLAGAFLGLSIARMVVSVFRQWRLSSPATSRGRKDFVSN